MLDDEPEWLGAPGLEASMSESVGETDRYEDGVREQPDDSGFDWENEEMDPLKLSVRNFHPAKIQYAI